MMNISISSDNLVQVDELTNEQTDAYVNDATITMTLRNSSLTAISGAEDLSVGYVAASDGRYQGLLPDTLTLTAGSQYYLDVSITSGSLKRFDRIPCRANYSQGD